MSPVFAVAGVTAIGPLAAATAATAASLAGAAEEVLVGRSLVGILIRYRSLEIVHSFSIGYLSRTGRVEMPAEIPIYI
jgi:hypothetical protein